MNILPESQKEFVKTGLKRRFLIVSYGLVSLVLLAGAVMLLPAYFLTSNQISSAAMDVLQKDQDEFSMKEYLELPTEIESKLKIYQQNVSNGNVSAYVAKVVQVLPQKVFIKNISITRNGLYNDKRGVVINVGGMAEDRESLLKFSNDLKESNSFSSVDLPISSLTKDKNLPYTMILFIAK